MKGVFVVAKQSKLMTAHYFIERYEEVAKNAYLSWDRAENMAMQNDDTEDVTEELLVVIHWAEMANGIYDCAFMVGIKGLVDTITDMNVKLQKRYANPYDMDGLLENARNRIVCNSKVEEE